MLYYKLKTHLMLADFKFQRQVSEEIFDCDGLVVELETDF